MYQQLTPGPKEKKMEVNRQKVFFLLNNFEFLGVSGRSPLIRAIADSVPLFFSDLPYVNGE